MSKFGRKVLRAIAKKAVKRAVRKRRFKRMVKKSKHVKAINHARPTVGGIMLT